MRETIYIEVKSEIDNYKQVFDGENLNWVYTETKDFAESLKDDIKKFGNGPKRYFLIATSMKLVEAL